MVTGRTVVASLAALFLLLTLGQGLLAGLFVTGDASILALHSAVGSSLPLVALVLVVVAMARRRAVRSWRLVLLSLCALVFTAVQVALGTVRVLAPHIFLGVATAALATFVLVVAVSEEAR